MAIEVGEMVQVVDRAATPADVKGGLFYNHFRNLTGVVDRVYADGALCIIVDYASLRSDMLSRLKRAERVIKPRWKPLGAGVPAAAPATNARESDDGAGDGNGADTAPTGDEIGGEEPFIVTAPTEEPPPEVDDADNGKTPQGLRYAIVVKAEDVRVAKGGAQGAAPAR